MLSIADKEVNKEVKEVNGTKTPSSEARAVTPIRTSTSPHGTSPTKARQSGTLSSTPPTPPTAPPPLTTAQATPRTFQCNYPHGSEDSRAASSRSERAPPKIKGGRPPLSEKARRAKREKEKVKRRTKRQAAAEAKRKTKAGPAAVPIPLNHTPNRAPNSTLVPRHPPLRSPSEVFGRVDPKFTLTVTRAGAGDRAKGVISMALLFAKKDFTVGPLRSIPDGVTFDVGVDGSIQVVSEVLEADGWTITQSPVWARFSFVVPEDHHCLPLDKLVRALLRRNGREFRGTEGIPDLSIRGVSTAEEGGERTGTPKRLRAWVDVSPEGEEYLARNAMLLRTTTSGLRLRPAPRGHRNSVKS